MSARTHGPALVLLVNGRAYHADVQIRDGLVHAHDVKRKLEDGSARVVDDRVWSPRSISEVRWEAVAA